MWNQYLSYIYQYICLVTSAIDLITGALTDFSNVKLAGADKKADFKEPGVSLEHCRKDVVRRACDFCLHFSICLPSSL